MEIEKYKPLTLKKHVSRWSIETNIARIESELDRTILYTNDLYIGLIMKNPLSFCNVDRFGSAFSLSCLTRWERNPQAVLIGERLDR